MTTKKYDHKKVEKKWQDVWLKEKVNYPKDILKVKNKFYNLWMYPYPSGEGLHAGHAFASTGSDIYGRFMRMNGKNVFQPIGYDSFGMHSENYALKIGEHPKDMLERTTKNYERQMKSLGHGFDWTRTVSVSDIDYYKWTQWIFVQLFKAGLAYRKKSNVNWCPSCKTVLADEQVMTPAQAGKEPKMIDGSKVKDKENAQVCERCGYVVEEKALEQWFLRITDYADRLLDNLKKIDWTEKVKIAQRNWIGRSEGLIEKWKVRDMDFELETFTTWPHTTYGATFMVIAPEHPIIHKLVKGTKYEAGAKKFIREVAQDKINNSEVTEKEKKGYFIGRYVINPLVGHKMPLYVANFAIMGYGTGIVKCTPTHDQRDFEFAKKYKLPRILVVTPKEEKLNVDRMKEAYTGSGVMTENTGRFKGMLDDEAREAVAKYSIARGHAKRAVEYHLRDWLISRQRYWGPPIPMIYCEKCAKEGKSYFTLQGKSFKGLRSDQSDWEHAGWHPVAEKDLPVELPYLKDFKPKGGGRGPLADHPEFYETKCPECGGKARRETDVSDTFVDSSWYFLRYPTTRSANSGQVPFDQKITKKWLPVDLYFGGAEHSVLHLMYARFVTQVLHDLKYLKFEEPFPRFYAHGLMIKDGAKMSKSRGNVVNPDEYVNKFGADALRLYLMFMGPMDGYPDFRDTGIEGMRRFVERIWNLFRTFKNPKSEVHYSKTKDQRPTTEVRRLIFKQHQTIKKVTEDIEEFHYNTAISAIMEYVNALRALVTDGRRLMADDLKPLVLMLAPLAPHLAEEIWVNVLGEKFSIHKAPWPKYNAKYIKEDRVTIAVQVNGKLRGTLTVDSLRSTDKKNVINLAKEDEKIKKWVKGRKIKKEIFVDGKLVNFVV